MKQGTKHKVPDDLKKVLITNKELLNLWDGLTPLGRNEWICWITTVKKEETRNNHIKRLQEELPKGKRRPCCWSGCPHHRPSAQKWLEPKRK